MPRYSKLLPVLMWFLFVPPALASSEAKATKPHTSNSARGSSKSDSLQAPLTDVDLKQREHMKEISRQLGVTCAHCHDVKNFKDTSKPAYKISKTHIEMVQMLNDKYPGQIGAKVDCYMCHRGQAKWDYKEKRTVGQEE